MDKRALRLLVIAAVIAVIMIGAFLIYGPNASEGEKAVSLIVRHSDGEVITMETVTEAEYLREVLDEENLVSGRETEFGLWVETVDGETADEAQQQWWCISKDGEMLMTGVDGVMIADGDHYEITFTTGW